MVKTATKPKPKPKKKAKPEIFLESPGVELLSLVIPERAVPWSAPTVSKNGTYKGKRLVTWQGHVSLLARLALGKTGPYEGPVHMRIRCWFAKGPLPDLTNIVKGIEDCLQSLVFVNDTQVVSHDCKRFASTIDEVHISVYAAEAPEEPGSSESYREVR